jgi:rod shape-determining protein MreC
MKNVIIEPYVDFNKLEQVLVVIPKDIREIKY